MMSKRTLLACALLTVAAAVAVASWLARGPRGGDGVSARPLSAASAPRTQPLRPQPPAPQSPAALSDTQAAARRGPAGQAADSADLPIPQRILQLETLARDGDPVAACRLSAELLRCRAIRTWSSGNDRPIINQLARMELSDEELEQATRRLVDWTAHNQRVKTECDQVPRDSLRAIPFHVLASARAGNVASMVQFASAAGMGGEEIVADPALYHLYRTHGWEMFRRAFEAGHPGAVMVWSQALESQGFSFLAGLVPEEWRRPELAHALNQRLLRDVAPAAQPATDRAGTAEIDAEAEVWYQRHFAASPWHARFVARYGGSGETAPGTATDEPRLPRLRPFLAEDEHCDMTP